MDHPRVSMVVLAFNQEAFVGEAIAAALAQDYPNLEIVLSDDGSSDATVEIMERAARDYAGPHAVIVNQTSANRGILSHFYDAVARSTGQFIVGAAGDDLSLPHRVSRLVETWRETGADAVFSTCSVINDTGEKMANGAIWLDKATQSYFPGRLAYKISGAMAGYDRTVFTSIQLPEEVVWCEDLFLSIMIHYNGGKIVALPEQLVLYRNHASSLTNSFSDDAEAAASEAKASRLSADFANTLKRFEDLVERDEALGAAKSQVDVVAVRKVRTYYEFSRDWAQLPLGERLRRATAFRTREQLRWTLPRLFGLPTFLRIKAVQRLLRPAR